VAPGQLALEATIDMLAAGVEHVAVVAVGEVVGIVAAGDLMALDMRSPMALRHTINNAADEDAVVAAVRRLPQLFRLLLDAGLPPSDMGRVLSLQNDAATARLLDLALARHGPAPAPWAWLVLGSAARREFTLASDQDNALAYADRPEQQQQQTDAYFARIGAEVNAGLARCGFGPDNNDVLAGNRNWRMSESEWLRVFDDCLRQPDESRLIRATVGFDFRHGAGGLAIAAPLAERVRRAREHPDFIRQLARTATDYPVALGFRERLAVARRGPDAGKLDLKRQAVIPLVNLARFHALSNGITISPTLDRLDAAQASGGLDADTAEALREAVAVIGRLRLEHHAVQIAAGQAPDNLLDPGELAPIAQTDLREALRSVARAQKRLRVYVPPGI
jgi:CBS domain-containing protein